ncbi:metallophosphoesterase family protein [Lignipirellula cremea]|uniref:Cyclic 3',5'-adenosine monophosphate phosphodiesterase n=1 Tax=Lignipirellula cremea TaxID=2528010 RepID=A0A518E098_9BACT|nr:metallophosphoesterase [Lignipirellula cremea]QDU97508.1 cyclic 3',5'-adenosine monophosphate phosphodiesterase [Lignipirellula cremea]
MSGRPSVTRRSFLSATLATGAALSLRPRCLQAAGRDLKPLTFAIVTDTHVGYRMQESAAKQWEKTAAELREAPGELVLHLGDLVDQGQESQYPIYLAAREKIGKPVHEIPGNHDPAALFTKFIRPQIDTTVDLDWLRFVLIGNAHTDSHDGFLTAEQNAWIADQCRLAAEQQKYVVLCMHVPAHTNRNPDRGWYVKPDNGQTALYETVQKFEDRILGLLHGHFHNGLRGWDDHGPVQEICFPSALYNLDRKLEEREAPGYNPLEFRPGYTLAEIKNGVLTLTYKPLAEEPSIARPCKLQQLAE